VCRGPAIGRRVNKPTRRKSPKSFAGRIRRWRRAFRRNRSAPHDWRAPPPKVCRWIVFLEAVRLFTRRGYDWTGRYPAIASAAGRIRAQSFTLDGEAVVCGEDGIAIFNALHRHGTGGRGHPAGVRFIGAQRRGSATGNARQPPGIEFNAHTATRTAPRCSARLRDGLGGDRLEAPGSTLSIRPVPGLDQGQEP
jgi:hypothetical protein